MEKFLIQMKISRKKHKNVQFITTYVKIKLIKENRQKKEIKKLLLSHFVKTNLSNVTFNSPYNNQTNKVKYPLDTFQL